MNNQVSQHVLYIPFYIIKHEGFYTRNIYPLSSFCVEYLVRPLSFSFLGISRNQYMLVSCCPHHHLTLIQFKKIIVVENAPISTSSTLA